MRKAVISVLLLAGVFVFAACMIPEKFKAKYEIQPDGNYTFTYDGTMIDAFTRMAKLEAKEKGQDIPADQIRKESQGLLDEIKADPRVKSIEDKGDERYAMRMEETGNFKTSRIVAFLNRDMSFWHFSYNPEDKTLTLKIARFKSEDINTLEKLNVTIDGKIIISTKCKVLEGEDLLKKSFFGSEYTLSLNKAGYNKETVVVFQLEE